MDHRRQSPSRVASTGGAGSRSKENSAGILPRFEQLWEQCIPAFDQQRVAERAPTLALSSLLCLGRHTVTGLLTTSGSQFQDWNSIFSQDRLPVPEIFSVVRRSIAEQLPAGAPFRAVLDDSLLRPSGPSQRRGLDGLLDFCSPTLTSVSEECLDGTVLISTRSS